MVAGLRKIQDRLEQVIAGNSEGIDSPKTKQILADYANRLFEIAEEATYPVWSDQ